MNRRKFLATLGLVEILRRTEQATGQSPNKVSSVDKPEWVRISQQEAESIVLENFERVYGKYDRSETLRTLRPKPLFDKPSLMPSA